MGWTGFGGGNRGQGAGEAARAGVDRARRIAGPLGLVLLALATLGTGCRLAGPLAVVEGVPGREPPVRVGIVVDRPDVVVSAGSAYDIVDPAGRVLAEAAAERRWTFTSDVTGTLHGLSDRGERITVPDRVVSIRPRDPLGPVRIDDVPYRGEAAVFGRGHLGVTAINVVALEAYLLGVVPAEMPALELEAVKAQAVAARTYAIGQTGRREPMGFDLFATVQDQVYAGLESEHPMTSQAVRETRGEILVHDGSPINAFYHSTCGGRTAGIDEAWGGPPVPYLRSVSDGIPGTDRAYCDISNRYRWSVLWTPDELAAALTRGLAAVLDRMIPPIRTVLDVTITERTPSGRAAELRIVADGEDYRVYGDTIRRVLQPEPDRMLNSTFFALDVARSNGAIRALEARGGGWGHGVGMCQMGAIGRAQAGHDYRRILAAYYTGARVVRVY